MLSVQSVEKTLASTKSSKSVRFGSPPIGLSRLNMKSGWPNAVVICSMCRYPRTPRSTIVARTSRGSAFSSTSVPASAGISPGGGSYSGLTERVAAGSRPYAHQTSQPKPNARSGRLKGQLSLTNQRASASAVGRPTALAEARWFVSDNWPFSLPLLAFGFGWLVWWAYGRDPAATRSVKPEYEPPPGLIPAEAGTLVDEKAEPREVLATIVDLAVRGYLQIEQITTAFGQPDFMFKRLKPIGGDPNLEDFELYVLAKLFSTDWALNMRLLSEVRRDYDHVFPPIRDRLYRLMVADGLFPSSPGRMRRNWTIPGALLIVAAFVLPGNWPSWLDAYGITLPIAIGASGVVLLGWSRAMAHRTWRGVQVLARVRGFQEFLERAEKDRLERMPADTLHRFLPWAISLGVTERWIFNFDGIKVDAPAWYTGRSPFSLDSYHAGLTLFGRDTTEAILTTRTGGFAQGESGFGSGGGSGGASGGGAGGGGGGTF